MVKKAEEIAIKVKGVSKTFKLPHEKNSSIKSAIVNVGKRKKGYEIQQALKNISFEVKKGEFFGIVGRNGSGKSTLLKLISEIYTPDSGKITVNGRLTPFIELGVGFNPELSGRDNVFLNGALLGFGRTEMELLYDEIVAFAEIERFMDQKLKNYSSGMQVRLAFSIAIQAKSDILVLDEVLAVGDEAFQKKCFQYFAELKKDRKTVILVTHDMDAVQRFCNKAIMIEKSEIVKIGNPAGIAQSYRKLFVEEGVSQNAKTKKRSNDGKAENDFVAASIKLKQTKDSLKFNISVQQKKELDKDTIVALGIVRDTGEQVYRWASDEKIEGALSLNPGNITLEIDNIFPEATFDILLVVKSKDRSKDFGTFNDILRFEVAPRTGHKWDTFWKPSEKFIINPSEPGGV